MKSILRLISTGLLFFFAQLAHATGGDPIGWSQTGSLPATSSLNHSYAVSFTIINNLPFTMPTPLYISNNSTPASEVTMIDKCSGLKLAPQQTCSVGLVLIPKAVGAKSLSVFMEYGSNKVKIPNPSLSTTTVGNSTSQLQGTVPVGFPTDILNNTNYPLTFKFTNNTSGTLTGLTLSQSSGNTAGFTQGSTTCTASLAASASCIVTGSYITSATSGAVTVGMTLTNGTLTGTATTSTIVNPSSKNGVRTITFTNNSAQTVWFGLVGGAVNTNPCTSDSQCSQGSSCNPSANAGAGECFYNTPVPVNGSYQLTNGQSNSVLIPDYGLQYVWSGNMAARTGATCATGTCDTADCGSGGGNNGCPVGGGFAQPATLSEFTLQRNTVDSYDISMINGVNVGNQITPSVAGTSAYVCTSPGSQSAQSFGLGTCDWLTGFTPPSAYYVYVKPSTSNPSTCVTSATCTSSPDTTCGLNFDKTTNTFTKGSSICGQFLGYVTANQVCSFANTNLTPGSSNNPGDPFFACDTSAGSNLAAYTNWGLFACKAQANGDLGTCYNTAANPPASTPNCCGCVDWQNAGGGIVVPSTTTTCVNTDTTWTSTVYNGVSWLKKACPTAYSYPFDDKASGFSCSNISGSSINTVNYTITFLRTV